MLIENLEMQKQLTLRGKLSLAKKYFGVRITSGEEIRFFEKHDIKFAGWCLIFTENSPKVNSKIALTRCRN